MIQFDGPAHIFEMGWETKPPKYLENQLLLISINFTTKTSNPVA